MTPRRQPLMIGDPVRIGLYRLEARLGRGGMGSVYLGRGPDGRRVAVKVLRADLAAEPTFRRLFDREFELARRVARIYTPEVIDHGTDRGQPYIVSEFIDGPTLSAVVSQTGPLEESRLERVAVAVARALAAIHEAGAVHCDLKPSNILLSPEGPMVIDFGIARALDATTQLTGSIRGTPAFMAPEQARGHAVGPPADIFAWGGVIVFAATGRPPFGTGSVQDQLYRAVNGQPDLTGVPERLLPVVTAAMATDPALRPTAAELHARLTGSGPVSPVPTPAGTLPGQPGPMTPPVPMTPAPVTTTPTTVPPIPSTVPPPVPVSTPVSVPPGATPVSVPPGATPASVPPGATPAPPSPPRPRRRWPLVAVPALVAVVAAAVALPLALLRGDDDGGGLTDGAAEQAATQLAADALEVRENQPDLARRLALAAYETAPTPEAERAVLAAFAAIPGPVATLTGHTAAVWAATVSPDGTLIATRSEDGTARLWDAASRGETVGPLATLAGGAGGASGVAFSPDGDLLATSDTTGGVRVWDPASRGDAVAPLAVLAGHGSAVSSVTFSPDGSTFATGSLDGTVRLWDAASRDDGAAPLAVLTGHTATVWGVAYSPDGGLIAAASEDGTVMIWDATARGEDVAPRATLAGHSGRAFAVAFSPDGELVASTGADDYTVLLWDATSEGDVTTPLATLTGFAGAVYGVAFSPDGALVAARGEDGAARLWDAAARGDSVGPLATLIGHAGPLQDIAFSPDGRLLATAGVDRTVRLWDPSARGDDVAPLATLAGHAGQLWDVAFSPDGGQLVTSSEDGTARLWDVDPARLAERACADPNDLLTAEAWAEHLPGVPYQRPCA
ncbi:MAG: serine/threonine protein kinase [Frankia sp.]|nr:serine/threonine protein kinase [Frankia sp.]